MKKNSFWAFLLLLTIANAGCDKKEVVKYSQLPEVSQTFIETHFSGVAVSTVVREQDNLATHWSVYLVNGVEIEFEKKGQWEEVDCKTFAVPASILALIPAQIITYCQENFPTVLITQVNKENYGYEIGLSNDMDIEFNSKGEFRKID
ncbi:MAG: PepSY-like domain-containing protein [Bacteroidales bacterium]|jgi:hypothetical protein|nr:PepSY-like domain-containing protein [Bacteroidales bacterium]